MKERYYELFNFLLQLSKAQKGKKKEEQKETKRIFPFFLIHVLQPSTLTMKNLNQRLLYVTTNLTLK